MDDPDLEQLYAILEAGPDLDSIEPAPGPRSAKLRKDFVPVTPERIASVLSETARSLPVESQERKTVDALLETQEQSSTHVQPRSCSGLLPPETR